MNATRWMTIAALVLGAAATSTAQGRGPGVIRFQAMDTNGDGVITREECLAAFDRLDVNHDGQLTREELDRPPAPASQDSAAYRAGYERGRQEGIQAGREDKPRHWDLEGQRELETADSGYEPRLGSRTDYQAGYRVGFRSGYKEGFGPR